MRVSWFADRLSCAERMIISLAVGMVGRNYVLPAFSFCRYLRIIREAKMASLPKSNGWSFYLSCFH